MSGKSKYHWCSHIKKRSPVSSPQNRIQNSETSSYQPISESISFQCILPIHLAIKAYRSFSSSFCSCLLPIFYDLVTTAAIELLVALATIITLVWDELSLEGPLPIAANATIHTIGGESGRGAIYDISPQLFLLEIFACHVGRVGGYWGTEPLLEKASAENEGKSLYFRVSCDCFYFGERWYTSTFIVSVLVGLVRFTRSFWVQIEVLGVWVGRIIDAKVLVLTLNFFCADAQEWVIIDRTFMGLYISIQDWPSSFGMKTGQNNRLFCHENLLVSWNCWTYWLISGMHIKVFIKSLCSNECSQVQMEY